MKIDKKIIKELTEYLDEFKLTELEYTVKDTKIKVSKTVYRLIVNHFKIQALFHHQVQM